jgi:hypothetical protein
MISFVCFYCVCIRKKKLNYFQKTIDATQSLCDTKGTLKANYSIANDLSMKTNIQNLVAEVAKLNGNRFASLTYAAKGTGEIARHTIQLGFSYHNSIENSFALCDTLTAEACGVADETLFAEALAEVKASLQKTLDAHALGQQNANYTKADVYVPLFNGLNVSKTDGSYKLFGLTVAKTVLVSGVHKAVKSAPLTVAKNKIRKDLPVGAFREFAIDESQLALAKINGATIEF